MLTLYYKPTCVYSQDVIAQAEALGLKFNLKDISGDPYMIAELYEQGGKHQTPFLIDTEQGVKMYESEDIIAHLKQHYAAKEKNSFGGLQIHQSDEICDSCQ